MKDDVIALIDKLGEADGMVFGPIFNTSEDVEGLPQKPPPSTAGARMKPLLASADELYSILTMQFGVGYLRPAPEFDDVAYYLPTREMVDMVVLAAKEVLPKDVRYWSNVFDCDDFAYCLKAAFSIHRFQKAKAASDYAGMAAGLIWGGDPGKGHVANVVVTVDQGVLVVDANGSKDPDPAELWAYPPRYIII